MRDVRLVVEGARRLLEQGRSHAAWRLLAGLSEARREETPLPVEVRAAGSQPWARPRTPVAER